jgi:hypothetical protein
MTALSRPGSRALLSTAGIGSLAGLVEGLQLNLARSSPHPQILWLTCPVLLYWLIRLGILARRGAVVGDPVVFAIKDRVSWLAFALAGVAAFLAV